MRAALVAALTLSGCYVSARGGPSYDFDGDRRAATIEVVVGAEVHLVPGGLAPSPIGRRFALRHSLGYKRASAAGAAHHGAIYELGGAVHVALPSDDPEVGTFVRADVTGAFGKLAGVAGVNQDSDPGVVLRGMTLVEVERFSRGWAFRLGAGAALEMVAVDAGYERSYAPVGAATFAFTPLITRGVRAILGR